MGCVASTIDKEEKVKDCKDRKKLMKQLVKVRGEFSDAQLAYLRALRNTGVTLRQFTESESLELENTQDDFALLPSPPPPLPPSPPPLPPLSPYSHKFDENNTLGEVSQEESLQIDKDHGSSQQSHPILGSSWDWYPFEASSHHHQKNESVEQVEEESWAETKTEFEDKDQEGEAAANVSKGHVEKPQPIGVDGDSSVMCLGAKDATDVAMVICRRKKTLESIVKEIDDYFLKAAAGGKEIAILLDINEGDNLLPRNFREHKRKRRNSAKVFSVLSWGRSSKSQQFHRRAVELSGPSEPCRPGAHCITLKKMYAAEQRLYNEYKEEEIAKTEHERKSLLLQKQQDENYDWTKTEKTRLRVESLESDKIRLQESISNTISTILELIDEELYPQLVALTSGLIQMWRTMHECHIFQYNISQLLNHLSDNQRAFLNGEYHHQATVELETEVAYWYDSFCILVKYQREYVRILCRWIILTNCLMDDHQKSVYLTVVCRLCKQWEIALDRLPDKVAADAIKDFLLAIRSITLQQAEEDNLQKRAVKLEKKWQKECESLAAMEKKFEEVCFDGGDDEANNSELSPRHPLAVKRAKMGSLKKSLESEKAKYFISVQESKAMALKILKTKLPDVFQSLVEFSSASVEAIEDVHSCVKPAEPESCEGSQALPN